MRGQAEKRGIADRFLFASAGTGNWHVGGSADVRSAQTAARHGLDLSAHRARQITAGNIHDWDWFIAMDADNRRNLLVMGAPDQCVLMMRQFESEQPLDVPDPYYGGEDGFEEAYHMLCDNADRILDYLIAQMP